MRQLARFSALPLAAALLFGCGGGDAVVEPSAGLDTRDLDGGPWDDDVQPIGRVQNGGFSDATDLAERLTGDVAVDASAEFVRGLETQRITLEDTSRARYAIDFASATGQVVQIEGVVGPHLALVLEPSGGFVPLTDALTRARDVHPGPVDGWSLTLDLERGWVYEVVIDANGERRVVILDALSGEVR